MASTKTDRSSGIASRILLSGILLGATAGAQELQPTAKLLYTFVDSGFPSSFREVAPGRFVGVNQVTPGATLPGLVEAPRDYLYAFYGLKSGGVFGRMDYQGNVTQIAPVPAGFRPGLRGFYGSDGYLYDYSLSITTLQLGLFRLSEAGVFSWIVPSMPTGGVTEGLPALALVQASNGKLYGT